MFWKYLRHLAFVIQWGAGGRPAYGMREKCFQSTFGICDFGGVLVECYLSLPHIMGPGSYRCRDIRGRRKTGPKSISLCRSEAVAQRSSCSAQTLAVGGSNLVGGLFFFLRDPWRSFLREGAQGPPQLACQLSRFPRAVEKIKELY